MTNNSHTEDKGSAPPNESPERAAIRALGLALNESLKKISESGQSQLVSMMGLAAILASLPETASVNPTRVGTMVGLLAQGRPDAEEIRDKVSTFAARILSAAQNIQVAPLPSNDTTQSAPKV